jgi:hypothetical protein
MIRTCRRHSALLGRNNLAEVKVPPGGPSSGAPQLGDETYAPGDCGDGINWRRNDLRGSLYRLGSTFRNLIQKRIEFFREAENQGPVEDFLKKDGTFAIAKGIAPNESHRNLSPSCLGMLGVGRKHCQRERTPSLDRDGGRLA